MELFESSSVMAFVPGNNTSGTFPHLHASSIIFSTTPWNERPTKTW
jgi:hypothetical protein